MKVKELDRDIVKTVYFQLNLKRLQWFSYIRTHWNNLASLLLQVDTQLERELYITHRLDRIETVLESQILCCTLYLFCRFSTFFRWPLWRQRVLLLGFSVMGLHLNLIRSAHVSITLNFYFTVNFQTYFIIYRL